MEGHTANTARRAVAGPTTPCRMAFGALPALVFYADRGMAGGAGDYRLPRSVFRKKPKVGHKKNRTGRGVVAGPLPPATRRLAQSLPFILTLNTAWKEVPDRRPGQR